jgi:hypothetical protein
VSAHLGLTSTPKQLLSLETGRRVTGLFAELFSFLGEANFENVGLLETPPLDHGALLSSYRKAGARSGVLITDKYLGAAR